MHFNEISGAIVDSAMKVHSSLGPGLLESVYLACLVHELNQRGFHTMVQLPLPVIYEGVRLDLGFRLDILVENFVVVEIKAVDAISPIHQAQLLTYLRLSNQASGPIDQLQCGALARWHPPHGKWRPALSVLCVLCGETAFLRAL
jgi:GxxExxY protein